ncbi:Plasmodium variant antigen protein Cir/Yir/Bir, putative, partial [Plasmodium chabaudi chabaudi]
MTNPNYDIEKVYRDIYAIEDYFYVAVDDEIRVDSAYTSILKYCNYENTSEQYNSHDYFQLASCGFIYLLITLKEKYKLEDDKLAEYVILWLSYKLNQSKKNTFKNLSEFYNSYIEKNEDYNGNDSLSYKDIIDKKKDLMDMDIKEISKFN